MVHTDLCKGLCAVFCRGVSPEFVGLSPENPLNMWLKGATVKQSQSEHSRHVSFKNRLVKVASCVATRYDMAHLIYLL